MRRHPSSTRTTRVRLAGLAMAIALGGCNAISGVDDVTVASSTISADAADAADVPSGDDDGSSTILAPQQDVDAGADATSPTDPDPSIDDAGADATLETDAAPPSTVIKHVFVTSDMMNGNLKGLAKADQICNETAEQAGLSGDWLAWLSAPGVNAIDRIEHTGPYRLLDDVTEVVPNKAMLSSGSISHAINMTEEKVLLTKNRGVWTGTAPNGLADATCNGWTSSSTSVHGTLASALAKDIGWTKGAPQEGLADNWKCNTLVSLYCFER